ncbi:MAG: DUF58 domain-containing protein [Oscillatoriales cyanobacterium]|jgi:uncharacterized protein (DUF58 family)|nr:MAG: DUF58 domain-containing protein [Oscillatoriales cyanobacterium]
MLLPLLRLILQRLRRLQHRLNQRLETHWVRPAYSGWVVLVISLAYLGAATNTMVGWLYAISGLTFALLGLTGWQSRRMLRDLEIERSTIVPVSVGETLEIHLRVRNTHPKQIKALLQIVDEREPALGGDDCHAIDTLTPGADYHWVDRRIAQRRGVHVWDRLWVRTGAPLGLFWARSLHRVPAKAVVYPQVLPLSRCPIIDRLGDAHNPVAATHDRQAIDAQDGVTRTLRAYRSGDPMRLIHWKSSARLGELRVRELETQNSGRKVTIVIDDRATWQPDHFEQAACAAASIYFYASRAQLDVRFWSAQTGLVQGHRIVLEALAAIDPNPILDARQRDTTPPDTPLLWLSNHDAHLPSLPLGSIGLLWDYPPVSNDAPRVNLEADRDLRLQLQTAR